MGFDVMREPWIDCVRLDGHVQTLCIRDLLLHAHELKEIRDASPLYEYGIYRLLTVIVMDMLQPQSIWDIQDLMDEGRFSVDQIDAYIALCEMDGPRFDIFDPVHPFLQDAFNENYDSENNLKPVAVMIPDLPSGNNHIHFEHNYAQSHTESYIQCSKALCAVSVFCTAGLQGPSSINGAPPMYVLVKGRTLFEYLTANSLCADSCKVPSYDQPPPAFRSNRTFTPGEKMASTSLLEGMTLKARRIHLVDGNGSVSKVYFQKGVDFIGYSSWRDPHTVVSEKGTAAKPNQGKELWRNTAEVFGGNSTAPLALQQYLSLSGQSRVDVIVYGLCTNQASLIAWSREELSMPRDVVNCSWRMQFVADAIAMSENVAKELERSLRSIHIGSRASWEENVRMTVGRYYASVRNVLFGEFVPELVNTELDSVAVPAGKWRDALKRTALSCYSQGADSFGSTARILSQAARAEDRLRGKLNKLLDKEGV